MRNAPANSLATTPSPGAQVVLDAARALFAEHGVDAVSIQDIASKAGVSKANVFHHFENKERLYLDVIRSSVHIVNTEIPTLIASPACFEERLLALMRTALKDMVDDPVGTRLVLREVTNGNAERAKLIATEIFSQKIRQRMAFFEDAQARGELREGFHPQLCDMLLGACCMFFFNCGQISAHISEELGVMPLDTLDAFSRAACAALTHGLAAPSCAARGLKKPRAGRSRKAAPAIKTVKTLLAKPRNKDRSA